MRSRYSLVVLGVASLIAGKASASTDINGLFDARSHAMGGTGVAFIDSANAVPINPALLDQVNKYSVSLDVFAIAAQPTAPYTIWHQKPDGSYYQNYESVRSKAAFAPLPTLGVAYRLHKRVVLGVATYPDIAQGTAAKYRPAPDEYPGLVATNKASMALIEAGDALSIRILDNLSLGLMWRITAMTQSVSTPLPTGSPPAGVIVNSEHTEVKNGNINVTGLNFKGFQIGVLWKPIPNLRIGFTYRNRVDVWGSGTTKTSVAGMNLSLKTHSGFTNPDSFRGGFAYSALDNKLLLAFDFKYLLYANAFKQLRTVVTQPNGMDKTNLQTAYWKNSACGEFGAEYKVTDGIAVRAGYTVLNSATNPTYALAFFAPAGISHLVTTGLGVKATESLNIDSALGFVILKHHEDTATPFNAGSGTYMSRGIEMSLMATYHK